MNAKLKYTNQNNIYINCDLAKLYINIQCRLVLYKAAVQAILVEGIVANIREKPFM